MELSTGELGAIIGGVATVLGGACATLWTALRDERKARADSEAECAKAVKELNDRLLREKDERRAEASAVGATLAAIKSKLDEALDRLEERDGERDGG